MDTDLSSPIDEMNEMNPIQHITHITTSHPIAMHIRDTASIHDAITTEPDRATTQVKPPLANNNNNNNNNETAPAAHFNLHNNNNNSHHASSRSSPSPQDIPNSHDNHIKKKRRNESLPQQANKKRNNHPSPDFVTTTSTATATDGDTMDDSISSYTTSTTTTNTTTIHDTTTTTRPWAVGLYDNRLFEEEHNFLPEIANKKHYINMRVQVVEQWRENVSKVLTLDDALKKARKESDKPYIVAAWTFLQAMGYINYGISKELHQHILSPTTKQQQQQQPTTVIVIGAGCSGLATARQLRSKGYKVLVVEGRHRPGGRVHTVKLSCDQKVDEMTMAPNVSPSQRHNNTMKSASASPNSNNTSGMKRNKNTTNITTSTNINTTNTTIIDAVTDLGGSIITGIDDNPLATLVKQLQIPMLHIKNECPLYMPNGTTANKQIDTLVEQHYNEVLMEGCATELKNNRKEAEMMSLESALELLWKRHYDKLNLPPLPHYNNNSKNSKNRDDDSSSSALLARQLLDWHFANLEFGNASLLHDVSLLHWDQDDMYEVEGAHCFVPGCNGRWLKELCHGIPILYNNPVHEIRYCTTGVAVHTAHKVIHADAVVVTVPLGVLKKEGITFNPPLSERKQGAISRLGFGNLNKVVMMFPYIFWNDTIDMFGYVQNEFAHRGEAFLFYSYAHISGGAQLTALIAGAAANVQDQRSDTESTARVMDVLRNIFEPQGITVPAPLHVLCTHWGNDPMAYGAYSSMKVGTRGGEDYDILSESIAGRVFFAGEATTKKYPATMHGAFFTGLWTAANVDATFRKMKAAMSDRMRNGSVVKSQSYAGKMAAVNNDKSKVASQQIVPTTEESVQEMLLTSAQLKLLFEDPCFHPDMAFGSFAAFFGPPGTEHAQHAVLQINFYTGKARQSSQNSKSVRSIAYCYVPKDVVYSLADIMPNEKRIAVLSSLPGMNLAGKGREPLPPEAIELVEAVLKKRKSVMSGGSLSHGAEDGVALEEAVTAAKRVVGMKS